jgi:hypothetical protein
VARKLYKGEGAWHSKHAWWLGSVLLVVCVVRRRGEEKKGGFFLVFSLFFFFVSLWVFKDQKTNTPKKEKTQKKPLQQNFQARARLCAGCS